MCKGLYWKVKSYMFIQIEDISFGSIESISRFSPNGGLEGGVAEVSIHIIFGIFLG